MLLTSKVEISIYAEKLKHIQTFVNTLLCKKYFYETRKYRFFVCFVFKMQVFEIIIFMWHSTVRREIILKR